MLQVNKRSIIVVFSFISCFFLTSCQTNVPSKINDNDKLIIYTSIYPLQFLTESIANEMATVTSIYPPGVDAHTYEPTLKEMTSIAKSDVFIYLGEQMESFSEKVAEALSSQPIYLIELSKYEQLFSTNRHNDIDPHIWLDPLRMIEMGKVIKNELIQLKPEYKDKFENNYENLVNELTMLDDEFMMTLQPKKNKVIVVSHAAYNYWEERYGIKQISVSGIISTDEPSQKELVKLVKEIRQTDLNYIIFDQTGEHRLSTIIQQHTNIEKRTIHDLEVLTEEDIKDGENYFTLMRKNLQTIDEITD